MTDAIRAEALTKYYGPVVGIEDLDLAVAQGEVFGFLGPNGAGKTTFIRVMLDLLRPTRGRVCVNGFDSRTASRVVRSFIGYLPADMPLYPDMSGEKYLRFLGSLQARVDGAWLEKLLSRFDIRRADLGRTLRDLSHGTRRKFGIIQALMGRPPLLVLDEPTSGLDPLMIEAFAQTIDELKAGSKTTIFLSSHVLSEVERLCDRVGIIRGGRLARQTSIRELREHTPRRLRVFFDGSAPDVPAVLSAAVTRRERSSWELEWFGPLGPLLDALRGQPVTDIQIDPFRLESYVLETYAEATR